MKWVSFILLFGAVLVFSSCKKKTADAQMPAQAAETTPAPAVAAAPAADPGAAAMPQQPAPVINTSAAISDANQALKAKDYQKAAATLIAVQQQPLTPQQAAAVHGQMVQLQGALAGAVASGDPNAKAAADRIRASTMH